MFHHSAQEAIGEGGSRGNWGEVKVEPLGLSLAPTFCPLSVGILDEVEFKRRAKAIALRVIRLVETLPSHGSAEVQGSDLRF